jgi:hypothetical protein
MPDDETPTAIGGAIATNRKPCFQDLAGLFQAVSSAGGDTTQTVTVSYRTTAGVIASEVKTLTGLTPVAFVANADRLLKALKSATTTGDVAVESQTAERSNTAQVGGLANQIILDAGASAVDSFFNDYIIRITGGTGVGQIRQIKAYVGATKLATVNWPWTTQPDGTSTFRISLGMLFDRQPYEITEVRRVFYNAAALAPGAGAVSFYDKLFYVNSSSGFALLAATVSKAAGSTKVSFGLAATINDAGTNGGGNNRTVAPAGITFATTPVAVPGTDLLAGSTIGVWLKLALDDGDAAQKTSVTMQLQGTSA